GAHHLALEFRGLAVRGERRPRLLAPRRHRQRLRLRGANTRTGRARDQRAFQKDASAHDAVAGSRFAELLPLLILPWHRQPSFLWRLRYGCKSRCRYYSARLPLGMMAASKLVPSVLASLKIAFSRLAPSKVAPRPAEPCVLEIGAGKIGAR